MLREWKQKAESRIGQQVDVSSDDSEDDDDGPAFPPTAYQRDELNQHLITLWLRRARARKSG